MKVVIIRNEQLDQLLALIGAHSDLTQAQYGEKLGVSKRTVARMFKTLQDYGVLKREGNRRNVRWIIIKK